MTQLEHNAGTDKCSDSARRLLTAVKTLADELRSGQAETFKPALDSLLDRDLGFDSLARMELLVRIEQLWRVSSLPLPFTSPHPTFANRCRQPGWLPTTMRFSFLRSCFSALIFSVLNVGP